VTPDRRGGGCRRRLAAARRGRAGSGTSWAVGGWQPPQSRAARSSASTRSPPGSRASATSSWPASSRSVPSRRRSPPARSRSALPVRRLAAGLGRHDPDLVFRRFADDVDDPIGDLVAVGLLIAVRRGARTVPGAVGARRAGPPAGRPPPARRVGARSDPSRGARADGRDERARGSAVHLRAQRLPRPLRRAGRTVVPRRCDRRSTPRCSSGCSDLLASRVRRGSSPCDGIRARIRGWSTAANDARGSDVTDTTVLLARAW
jgi:hypothetical protein